MVALHEKFLELGLESPFDERWFERPDTDHRITTRVDVSGHDHARTAAWSGAAGAILVVGRERRLGQGAWHRDEGGLARGRLGARLSASR